MVLYVNSTSSAVKGLPSCHFTFFRSLKVSVMQSLLNCHDSAIWDSQL